MGIQQWGYVDDQRGFQADRRYTVFDSFNRANGAIGRADSGQLWLPGFGSWTVAGNAATLSGGSGHCTVPTSTPDGTITCTINNLGGRPMGLLFRYTDASNFWQLCRDPGFVYGSDMFIERIVAGVATLFGPVAICPVNSILQVSMLGTRIRVRVNGVDPGFGTITNASFQTVARMGLCGIVSTSGDLWEDFTFDQRVLF